MAAVPAVTERKLRRVIKQILARPRGFNMRYWVNRDEGEECGTTFCVAGRVVINDRIVTVKRLLSGDSLKGSELTRQLRQELGIFRGDFATCGQVARAALGITSAQETRLFYATKWPEPFRSAYGVRRDEANGVYVESDIEKVPASVRAYIAAARIEHFIETGE